MGDPLRFGAFGPYSIIFMTMRHNLYHGNAVKGFWALWDNIYDCVTTFAMIMLLRDFGP